MAEWAPGGGGLREACNTQRAGGLRMEWGEDGLRRGGKRTAREAGYGKGRRKLL